MEYTERTLCRLINASENERMELILDELNKLGISSRIIPISDTIKTDPFFTEKDLMGHQNIIAQYDIGAKKTVLFNTHFDTVPAQGEMLQAKSYNGNIYGRGACDALGQVAMVLSTLKLTKNTKILNHNLILHFANCEETGGNGTLQLLHETPKADYSIVFEPTDLTIAPECRGALWFELEVHGKSIHMARISEGDNAIHKTNYILTSLEEYMDHLVEEAKDHRYFKWNPTPIQINVGVIYGGLDNAIVPDIVNLKGAVGFLSNKNISQIKEELRERIEQGIEKYVKKHRVKTQDQFRLLFNSLHNDPYELKPDEYEVVDKLSASCKLTIGNASIKGFPASCDSRLIYYRKKIPVAVFGPGDLNDAHSSYEKINLKDLENGRKILTKFLSMG